MSAAIKLRLFIYGIFPIKLILALMVSYLYNFNKLALPTYILLKVLDTFLVLILKYSKCFKNHPLYIRNGLE